MFTTFKIVFLHMGSMSKGAFCTQLILVYRNVQSEKYSPLLNEISKLAVLIKSIVFLALKYC